MVSMDCSKKLQGGVYLFILYVICAKYFFILNMYDMKSELFFKIFFVYKVEYECIFFKYGDVSFVF